MKKPQRFVKKASFPRMSELREELGWEVPDIVRRLNSDRPSQATVYRLDKGAAIRVASARRVFSIINAAYGGTLNASDELVITEDPKKKQR